MSKVSSSEIYYVVKREKRNNALPLENATPTPLRIEEGGQEQHQFLHHQASQLLSRSDGWSRDSEDKTDAGCSHCAGLFHEDLRW
jgi:hypothetical protein